MQAVGELVLEDSASLGDQAADDSTEALHELGAQIIEQKAEDIARQAEIYLATNPGLSLGYLQNDLFFEQIVVQELGGERLYHHVLCQYILFFLRWLNFYDTGNLRALLISLS